MKMMKRMFVMSILTVHLFAQVMPGLNLMSFLDIPEAEASYIQNNNTGIATIDFFGGLGGIQSLNSTGLVHDTSLGQLSYQGNSVGDFLLAPIVPSSFTTWGNLEIDMPIGNYSDLSVSLYSCTGDLIGTPNLPIPGGSLDISTLAAGYTCLQPLIAMADGPGPAGIIEEIRLTWQPLSFLSTSLQTASTVNACSLATYDLQYSLSYVDDEDVLIYVTLPSAQNGSFTPGYGQNLATVFDSATNGGHYTATGTTFLGTNNQNITVPANSVYWYFPTMVAGNTGVLKFKVRIPCGTENGTLYDAQAVADSVNAEVNQTPLVTSQVVSAPLPFVNKFATNDIDVGTTHFAYLPGNTIVNYAIEIANARSGGGSESMFNPTIVDDLNAVATTVNTQCTGLAFSDRLVVSNGGVYDSLTNTITWSQPSLPVVLALGQTQTVTYSIDYAGCNIDGLEFDNFVTLSADNIVDLDDSYTVTVLDVIEPFGMFAKHIGNTVDLLREYSYEQPFNYFLQASNPGISRLEDVIMLDKIPDDQVLNGPITLPNGVVGQVFYTTSGAALAPNMPPSYTIATAAGGNLGPNWTTTYTPNATWIAVYIRCLSSSQFPGSSAYCNGAPSTVTVPVPVRMTEPSGQECADTFRDNIANFTYHAASNSVTNLDTDIVPIASPSLVQFPASRGVFHPIRPIIQVTNPLTGPTAIDASDSATYSMQVSNVGQDASTSTIVTVDIPTIVKNGVTSYPTVQVLNAGGGAVTYNLPQNFVVDLGVLPVGQSRTIQFRLDQFEGVEDNSAIIVNASVAASDLECGSFTFTASRATTINGTSSLSSYKTKNLSYISQGDQIEYSLFAINDGNVVATNGFVVDKIPEDTQLLFVTTSGNSTNNIQYNCANCNVYFAQSIPQLPVDINILDPFTVADIFTYFTPGVQSSPGVWTTSLSNPVYIAVEIDNAQGFVATSELISFGITVQDTGNQPGETIRNYAGIVSDQNIQSITNQVETTLLDNPGLVVDIESDKNILESCEAFDWYVDYYSDAATANDTTSLSVTFPLGFVPTQVSHEWNAYAISGGATPSGNFLLSTGVYATGLMNPNGTYTYTVNINTLLGSSLATLEGGRLHFIVNVPCATPSNSVFDATVVGSFSNSQSAGITSDNDLIFVQNADLEVIKNVSVFDPLPGDIVSYTLDLANIGAHDAANIQIVDILQPGLCYQTGSVSIANAFFTIGEPTVDPQPCNPLTGQVLTWSVVSGSIFAGPGGTGFLQGFSEHLYITYQVLVDGFIPQGTDLLNGVTVSTTNPEDDYSNNHDDEQITTPYPDPQVVITGPASVLPGDIFNYTLTYSNNNRACANDAYVIHTLPDIDPVSPDGNADVTVTNISVTTGTIYVHSDLIVSGSVPAFDPNNPLSGGWQAWFATGTFSPINYIAVHNDYLCRDDGILPIYVTAQAADSVTQTNLPVGLIMPFAVEVFTPDADDDLSNNFDSIDIVIPGIDLEIAITGDPEGSYPGTVPGAAQQYLVTYSNVGSQASCHNFIEVTFSTGFIPNPVLSNFTTVSLVDSFGNAVTPVDGTNVAINNSSDLNVTMTNLGNNTYRFELGTSPANVCLPVGAQGSFTLFGTTDTSLVDGFNLITSAVIGEDSLGIEVVMSNNYDETFVFIYRADLFVTKTGFSYMGSPLTGSTSTTNIGETINYTIQYNNIGNTDADDVYLKEYIPEGTCYTVGTVEANLPSGATVTYYDSSNNVVTPVADVDGVDCSVDRFELYFATMKAPANLVGEVGGAFAGMMTDVVDNGSGLSVNTDYTITNVPVNGSPVVASRGAELMNIDGEIYAMFATESDAAANEIWHYDQSLEQFDYVAPLTIVTGGTVRYDLDTVEINGIWYAVIARNGSVNELMRFNTGANTFENVPTASGALVRGSRDVEIIDIQGVPYAIFANFNQANEIWKWDSGLNNFVNVPPGPGATGAFLSVAVKTIKVGNEIYVGFANDSTTNPHEIWRWDSGLQTFVGAGFATPATGIATRDMAGTSINGVPYFAFPSISASPALPNEIWGLNTGTNLFERVVISGTTVGRVTRGAVFQHTSDGSVFVYWGNSGTQGEIWKYNSNTNQFDVVTNSVVSTDVRASATALDYKGQQFILNPTYGGLTDQIFHYNDLTDSYSDGVFPGGGRYTHQIETMPYNGDVLIVASSTFNLATNLAHRLHIPDDGSYNVPIQPGPGFLSWGNLLVQEDLPAGTSITYTIYPDLTYTGTALLGPVLASNGVIDLSALATNPGPLGLHIELHNNDSYDTPTLESWSITYESSVVPSFMFDVKVSDNVAQLAGLNSVYNYVSIETVTPEITLDNNNDDTTHYFIQSDIFVDKSVNATAVQSGDIITYTLEYGNNGPHVAQNVVLTDVLPNLFSPQSADPFYDSLTNFTAQWTLGSLQAGQTGSITLTGMVACSSSTVLPAVQVTSFAVEYGPGLYFFLNDNFDNCVWLGGTSEYAFCLGYNTISSLPLCIENSGTYYNSLGEVCVPTGTGNFAECNGGSPLGGHCITDYVSEVLPATNLAVDPTVQADMLFEFGYDLEGSLPFVNYDYDQFATIAVAGDCPSLDDTLTNNVSVTTTTLETSYSNNTDNVTSIVGDYADVYTTVDCPAQALLDSNVNCVVNYGNQGNVISTGGNLILDLDIHVNFVSLTGYVGGTCTYSDNRILSGGFSVGGSHTVTCSGADFSTLPVGFTDTMDLLVHIQNNPTLAAIPALGANGVLLTIESEISTLTPEVTTTNNRDSDQIIVGMPLSTIDGNVYVDVLTNNQFNQPQDIRLANITVCLDGLTYAGISVGVTGTIVMPCTTTNSNGEYSFVGLLPGVYSVYYVNGTLYNSQFSNAGFVGGSQIGLGSLQLGAITATQIQSIILGAGQDSYDNDFGLLSSTCVAPLGLQILSPTNGASLSATTATINGQISNLSANVTMNGLPVSLDINGQFTLNQALPSSTNVFTFVASNGDSVCDEQYVLTLNVVSTSTGGGGGGGGGSSPIFDTCPCGDRSPSLIDGSCTEVGQSWSDYLAEYCPTTGPIGPTSPVPTLPSAPLLPVIPPEIELILPPKIPTVGPLGM